MTSMHIPFNRARLLAPIVVALAAIALPATAGAQGFGIVPNSFTASASSTQAGAHADVTTSFTLNQDQDGNPIDQLKDVSVDLPPGLVGNPQAIPKCSDQDFQNFNCPADSQVGVLTADVVAAPAVRTTFVSQVTPTTLQSTLTPCGFGCQTIQITVASTAGFRSGDYITIGSGATAEQMPVQSIQDATTMTVSNIGEGIQNTHNPGETVADDTITVASTTGFNATAEGDDNLITIGSGADAEQARIEFAPGDSTHLILTQPLANTHTAGEPVVHKASVVGAPFAIFNMQPDPGHVATLAGSLLIAKLTVEIDVRNDGSYGLVANIRDISSLLQIGGTSLTLWGVPGDPSHDAQRCGQLGFSCGTSVPSRAPFMTNPTTCAGGSLATTISVDSWQNPDQPQNAATTQAAPTGCDLLSFSPGLKVSPDNSQADTPAGYDVDLTVPQNSDPSGLAAPDVQNVTLALPAGTALSPAAANGLQGCTDAQFAANACPNAAKVGSVSIKTPLLPDNLTGSVFVGSPTATQMFRLFVIASGDNVTIRLTGLINPDPSTGRLTTVFTNNPQLPFSELNLTLFGGPLASLANPEGCGTFTTTSVIVPYGAPAATPSSSFNIGGCSGGFSPSFVAGTQNPTAGAFSPLSLTFSRQDSDQELSGISVTLPPGVLAKLAGVPLCPDAAANAGTCSSASQVGTATVGSGAGPQPLFLSGPVYLTGAYKGGQYGLATVVRAIAGPYDLGTVIVRQSLQIDPEDTHVTAVSDPFPTILKGVPLRIRTINLTLDRPGFTVNPTSCSPLNITGSILSVGGASVPVSSHFQVGGCQALPFLPKLGLRLSGKGQTTSGKHPTLTANLTQGSGQSNLRSAKVTLPLSLALDPNNSKHVCSYQVAQAVHGGAVGCPANTIVGSATAVSPLVPGPLTGPVYLVQGIRFNKQGQPIRTLPTLLLPLRGAIALDLRATTSVSHGQLVSTFGSIPDAAVSSFKLTINGGKKGLLVITGRRENVCKAPQTGSAVLTGQSGKVEHLGMRLGRQCPAHKPKKKKTKKTQSRTHASKPPRRG